MNKQTYHIYIVMMLSLLIFYPMLEIYSVAVGILLCMLSMDKDSAVRLIIRYYILAPEMAKYQHYINPYGVHSVSKVIGFEHHSDDYVFAKYLLNTMLTISLSILILSVSSIAAIIHSLQSITTASEVLESVMLLLVNIYGIVINYRVVSATLALKKTGVVGKHLISFK